MILLVKVQKPNRFERFSEFFTGFKDQKKSRTYLLMSIFLRKILYVGVMVTFVPMISSHVILLSIGIIEICITGYLIFVRPYQRLQNNLVELVNQLVFLSLISICYLLSTPKDWDESWESLVMMVVVGNNLLVVLIILCKQFLLTL